MSKIIRKTNYLAIFSMVFIAIMSILVGSIFTSARAQDDSGQGLDVTVNTTSDDMSPAEQLSWVREQTVLVKQVFKRVKNMLDQARQEKDTLKITCLDDKFTQIHVSIRGIEERTKSLEISLRSGDTTTANQNFSILKIYISRVFGLNSEAENCMGESDVVLGKTETSSTISGDITRQGDPDPDFSADNATQRQVNPVPDENEETEFTDNTDAVTGHM